jgi:cytosine/adenosine deaminase-related metal-dependent hydrolase
VSRFRADWIIPITDSPIRGGFVAVDAGRVQGVGSTPPADCIDLGRVAILPALVNAHTHLELSYLQGRIPPAGKFGDWVRAVMTTRREYPDPADRVIVRAAREAIRQARASGTGLCGDISNTLVTVPLMREGGLPGQVFYELTGFTEQEPHARVREARARAQAAAGSDDEVRVSVAPHAPYSVSPGLFQAIREDVDAHANAVSTVHLGEPAEEVELLRRGTGDLRAVLEELGRWPADWKPPGVSPVRYLLNLGFIDSRVLVVHGVQFDGDDLERLGAIGATLVSCPRSNVHVGVGSPPLEAFYAMDVEVAFGTDSLASVADLNMFSELREARRIAPRVPARTLLESATLIGARALGFEADYGSIEKGKRAALIAVRLPDAKIDVEEYLLSGIDPEAVTWVT